MQDMSGFVLSDTTLPPLDEQLDISISTAQTENDFYVQNPGLPSPAEFVLGDTSDDVISEDSDMFDNFNCDILDSKTYEPQAESPIKRNLYLYDNMHSYKTRTTFNTGDEESNLTSHKISFGLHKAKLAATVKKDKPRYLAIIDSEEPLIKEDPDLLYCTQNKMDFDIKADVEVADIFNSEELSVKEDMDKADCSTDFKDMGVAEEVTVMTEEDSPILDSVSSDTEEDFNIPEEKIMESEGVIFQLDNFTGFDTVVANLFNDLDEMGDEIYSHFGGEYEASHSITSNEINQDYLARPSTPVNDLFTNSTSNVPLSNDSPSSTSHPSNPHNHCSRSSSSQLLPRPAPKHNPLTLDIDAAREALLVDKGISDTPELLEALKPEVGKFDLIKFITTNPFDPNNNATSPTEESHQKKPEAPRKGTSHLSLLDLKQAQGVRRGETLSRVEQEEEEDEPLPSISRASLSGRPARQSATRFKKMIEDGLLCTVVDSQSVSSDEEDAPKAKRRRTTSTTSSRRRLNSDSDRSSVSGDAMKYRERRDRNNLSSKRSRQKRKVQHQLKQKELKELEDENARLRLKADELESVLTRVKAAWADYLAHMKDNDKDRR